MKQSDFVVYFDESGDHGLQSIDAHFPVFVLCGCVFRVKNYLEDDLALFSAIKFKHFGHDAVVLHSRDIRKRLGPFQVLTDKDKNELFINDISSYFKTTKMTLICAVINKKKHKERYTDPANPYSLSLLFCLERIYAYLKDNGETGSQLYCIFEKRGDVEDQQLAAEFEKICAGDNMWGTLPFRMIFASKLTNMPGLQIADLAAYPTARYVIDPKKPNPAFDVLKPKFRRSPSGKAIGWGAKIFP